MPYHGTDIFRSLIAIGCEFAFPIDYSTNKHRESTSSPSSVESYSKDCAVCLSALHENTQLLVQEHQAYHCKFINSRHPDPHIYSVGNIVFAQHAVWLDASKERVDKLSYPFTGLWCIIASFNGTSYDLEICLIPIWKMKKHALDLSLYPLELVSFKPIDML